MLPTVPTKAERALLPPFADIAVQRIHLLTTADDFARARQALLAAPMLGFDTESKPVFQANQPDNGPHLVQFATTEDAWLLPLRHTKAITLCRDIVQAPDILKVGFGLQHDRQQLKRRLSAELTNILDLDSYFSKLKYGHSLGVAAAVAVVLQQYFHKSKRTTLSNWASQTLTPVQIQYAANDAYAAARVYAALPPSAADVLAR